MKGRRSLALSVLAVALACQDHGSPTEPRVLSAPTGPAGAISDGAHGGNPDFFFLPPMVSNPVGNQNYEAARFNGTFAPRLTIEICRLQTAPIDANGNPVLTDCAPGVPLVKKFAAGTVQLQGTASDGHYQAQWHTRESNLDITKYYRIKVLIEGSTTPLGFADIDPMDNKGQLKNARTGEVIALIDDSTLPIKFRIEKSVLCNPGENLCTSTVVTNHTPNGEPQIVRIFGDDGSAIAGVLIPDGFLPANGPQSVVLTIDRVNTGVNNVPAGTQSIPCHANLPLQQFNSCFHFSTIPELATINEEGHQFLKALTVAVCFVLHDTDDPREPWVQLWSSEEGGEDTKPLPSAPDGQILAGGAGHTCGDDLDVVASNAPSNGFARLASAGWKKVKGGLGQLFGVKTAYAVDVGLGGLTFEFSNIGPALTAEIQRYTATDLTLGPEATTTSTARIVGTQHHHDEESLDSGIGGLPVTFTVAPGHGTLRLIGSEAPPATTLISITNTNPINPESPTSGGGFAPVNWTLPETPGTYTLTATGPATGGPVTFTATVTAPMVVANLTIPSEAPIVIPPTVSSGGGTVSLSPWVIRNDGGAFSLDGIIDNGFYLSTDPVITNTDVLLDENHNSGASWAPMAAFNWGGPELTIPERAPGVYYVGILVDHTNHVAETNEGDNYRSSALVVVDPDEAQNPWGPTERRMLSMQSGATYQVNISPATVSSWTSSDPTKATVSSTGLITAIIGNENQNGGGEASITSTLVTGGAGPNMLVNSFSFNLFPRVTTLAWKPIEGAVAYQVVTEFGNGSDPSPPFCSVPATCTTWTQHSLGSTYTTGLSHTFQFVGSQPGRWRVMAIAWNGAVIFTFPYVYFDYDV